MELRPIPLLLQFLSLPYLLVNATSNVIFTLSTTSTSQLGLY
jgi:hypothetical protein